MKADRLPALALAVGVVLAACDAAPAGTPPASGQASPGPTGQAATNPADPGTSHRIASPDLPAPTPSDAPSPSTPSGDPGGPTGWTPVHGSAYGDGGLTTAPMHDGGLYIVVHGWPEVLTSLDRAGEVRPGWPVTLRTDYGCDFGVAVDDSVRAVCGSAAYAYDAQGRSLDGWPVELGDESRAMAVAGRDLHVQIAKRQWVTVGPDGVVESREGRMPEADRYRATIRWAVDRWGEPTEAKPWKVTLSGAKGVLRGWPVMVPGSASEPVVGKDGTVYLVAMGKRYGSSRLIVINRAGKRVTSRTAFMKDVPPHDGTWYGPYIPQSPLVGPDGSVWVVGRTSAYAFDPKGRLRDGWPVKLRGEPGSTGYCGPCGDTDCYTHPTVPFIDQAGTLYVLRAPSSKSTGGSVLAIGLDGKVVPGWPVRLKRAGSEFWYGKVGPDGTVFVDAYEPEPKLRQCPEAMSLTTLALRPDSTIRYRVTLVDP